MKQVPFTDCSQVDKMASQYKSDDFGAKNGPIPRAGTPRRQIHNDHTMGYVGFIPPKIGGVRDQMHTIYDPEVDCETRVDF